VGQHLQRVRLAQELDSALQNAVMGDDVVGVA